MPTSSSDPHLIQGCLAGQEEAWEALVSKYERLIFATSYRYGLNGADAEEVFSRVCLQLVQHLADLRDQSRLSSWLITITSRECWRYKNAQPATLPLSTLPLRDSEPAENNLDLPDPAALPEEEIVQLETQQLIRESFQLLPARCQKLLWELFYNPSQPSYAQIAATLQMPTASIGPNRARCLEKLRAQLKDLE